MSRSSISFGVLCSNAMLAPRWARQPPTATNSTEARRVTTTRRRNPIPRLPPRRPLTARLHARQASFLRRARRRSSSAPVSHHFVDAALAVVGTDAARVRMAECGIVGVRPFEGTGGAQDPRLATHRSGQAWRRWGVPRRCRRDVHGRGADVSASVVWIISAPSRRSPRAGASGASNRVAFMGTVGRKKEIVLARAASCAGRGSSGPSRSSGRGSAPA